MNSFSSDQMLLPSINHLLDGDIIFPAALCQSLVSEDDLYHGNGVNARDDSSRPPNKVPKPPDSPVFSELTTPSYLLRMSSHDSSQLVPNLDVSGTPFQGFRSSSVELLEALDRRLDDPSFETMLTRDMLMTEFQDDEGLGSALGAIYIEDENNVPSPTPSTPFDAPRLHDTAELDLLLFPEHGRTERRKHDSLSTEDLSTSDSGGETSSCPSPTANHRPTFLTHPVSTKSKSGRTHNYKRRTIMKSLTELGPDGSGTLPSPTSERRKRGRPRKRLGGELSEKVNGHGRRKTGRKAVKGSHLWEFILDLLKTDAYCPQYIKWEDKDTGVFRIVNSKVVASKWGEIKNNPRMTYEKLSRAMRYYYKRQILERVDKARLVYKFGEKAEGWKESLDM
ncbi:uncharacterized protein [Diadema setosum]|uniref:uncharacterized protein n=1 Tax=Diadema setosum TaxID=31175 RepID=UPI003B3B0608